MILYVLIAAAGAALYFLARGGFGTDQRLAGIVPPSKPPAPEEPILSGQPPSKDAPPTFTLIRGDMKAASTVFGEDVRRVSGLDIGRVSQLYGLRKPADIIFAVHGLQFPELDPVIVRAIIANENAPLDDGAERFEAKVSDYSVGLMQLRIDTAIWMGLKGNREVVREALKNPVLNIAVGMKYLEYLRRRYQGHTLGNKPLAVWIAAAYNAGSCFWRSSDDTFSNQVYVDRFVRGMVAYAAAFPSRQGRITIP